MQGFDETKLPFAMGGQGKCIRVKFSCQGMDDSKWWSRPVQVSEAQLELLALLSFYLKGIAVNVLLTGALDSVGTLQR